MKKWRKKRNELKDSYFDGYEYKGYRVKTKLVIEGHGKYKPLKIGGPDDVYKAFKKLGECDKERFYSILLDTKNKVIGVDLVSQGSLDSTLVHPREVFKSALLASASSIIFVHSHPSGDPEPSETDRELTKKLKEAGKLLDISVLDHVIIGRDKYYSFKKEDEL
jgi:DNA repair protein RadC